MTKMTNSTHTPHSKDKKHTTNSYVGIYRLHVVTHVMPSPSQRITPPLRLSFLKRVSRLGQHPLATDASPPDSIHSSNTRGIPTCPSQNTKACHRTPQPDALVDALPQQTHTDGIKHRTLLQGTHLLIPTPSPDQALPTPVDRAGARPFRTPPPHNSQNPRLSFSPAAPKLSYR